MADGRQPPAGTLTTVYACMLITHFKHNVNVQGKSVQPCASCSHDSTLSFIRSHVSGHLIRKFNVR